MSLDAIRDEIRAKLGVMAQYMDLDEAAALVAEIQTMKQERNAIILAHNYMDPLLFHCVADLNGDSLDLSRKVTQVEQDVIVFCGVRFMAETAKILNPGKTVLLPTEKGGCSLAESIGAEDIHTLRKQFPGVPVVTYINTYADVKAESDLCCTSGNARAVFDSLDADTVIFLPDEYLAANIARDTGKHIVFPAREQGAFAELDYQVIGWQGRCEVHELFTIDDIHQARERYPGVRILSHPECPPTVCEASDFAGSTNAMIRYVHETEAPCFLLLTECAMSDNIAVALPDKKLVKTQCLRCPHMEEITLKSIRDALKHDRYLIETPEDIRCRALNAVEKMLAIG